MQCVTATRPLSTTRRGVMENERPDYRECPIHSSILGYSVGCQMDCAWYCPTESEDDESRGVCVVMAIKAALEDIAHGLKGVARR